MASFKIAGKARAVVAVNVKECEESRELITGVEGKKIRPVHEKVVEEKTHVIPALSNTYRAGGGKFTPSFVPQPAEAAFKGSIDDKFEAAAAPDKPLISHYGLEVRQRDSGEAARAVPVALPGVERDAAQFKADLETLPEEADLEAYESLPVEEFGKALLRGLGWSEGQGVGRKRKVVEPRQAVRRPERLGLGAAPAAPAPGENKRPRKMGDPTGPAPDLVVAPDPDGRQRHRAGLEEVLVQCAQTLPGAQPGKTCRVVGGRHEGLTCQVLELLPLVEGRSARARVRLLPSEQLVEVRCSELDDLLTSTGKPAAKEQQHQRQQQERHHHHHHGSSQDQRREGDREQQQQGSKHRSSKGAPAAAAGPTWLLPSIRVRILDKSVGAGGLYLKKGTVLDVHPGQLADVRVEGSHQVLSLTQENLETVVPKASGAAVQVVGGRHRGRRGRLLEVSTSKGVAAVQLTGGMEVVRVVLDDVAEFMGHLEEEAD